MRVRTFLVLLLVTVVAVIGAAVSVGRESRPAMAAGAGEKVFPDLLDHLDRLRAIRIRTADRTLTIRYKDGGWRLEEQGDYPVDADRVRAMVINLTRIEKLEPKTDRPDRYPAIRVEDVDQAGAKSREVAILDAQDQPLARLITGTFALDVGEEGGQFVRVPGEAVSWLVQGQAEPGIEVRDWVERRVVDLPWTDIREVRIVHGNGEKIRAVRTEAGPSPLALQDVPKGKVPKRPDVANGFGGFFSSLQLEDVRPASEVVIPDADAMTVTVDLFSGLHLVVRAGKVGGDFWMMVTEAKAVPPDGPGAARAAEIVARTKGYAYKVQDWKAEPITRRMADLVQDERAGS